MLKRSILNILLLMFAGVSLASCATVATQSSYMGIDIGSPTSYSSPSSKLSGDAGQRMSDLYKKSLELNCGQALLAGPSDAECLKITMQRMDAARAYQMQKRYGGSQILDTSPSFESQDLVYLARRAQAGNKYAQLQLGIRFEEGRGVARDLKKARTLYKRAARDSGGTIMVYSPPVGNGTSGRVIPVNAGTKKYGLAEAKRRLERLE